MDFEPHNFPALVASVIRSDSTLAEPLKEIFAAYGRSEDWMELLERFEGKYHHTLRLIFDDLNDIDDPVSLDQEIQVLLKAIDEALVHVADESAAAPKARKKAGKAKPAAKKKAGKAKPAKKAVKKKAAAAPKKKSKAKPAKKAKPAVKKKAAKPVKKAAAKKKAKPAAKKKAKPAAKKKKTKAKKK